MSDEHGWIQTRNHHRFEPLGKLGVIDIEDIAHHLALRNRYSGATARPYSVAQHSCIVANLIPDPSLRMWGLLHDAAEAYLPDVAHPIKADVFVWVGDKMLSFAEAEDRILHRIAFCFGLSWPMPPAVMQVDRRVAATERRDLMASDLDWCETDQLEPYPHEIKPLKWKAARQLFLETYERLAG